MVPRISACATPGVPTALNSAETQGLPDSRDRHRGSRTSVEDGEPRATSLSSAHTPTNARAFGLLFFLSGATGLVYELLWMRLLYQAFGSTTQSVTTVVAAYMGGLGLGAWWLGRRADGHVRPAALYGRLEIAIGAFGLLSPFLLSLTREVYIVLARSLGLSGSASLALRFGLAVLVLLVRRH